MMRRNYEGYLQEDLVRGTRSRDVFLRGIHMHDVRRKGTLTVAAAVGVVDRPRPRDPLAVRKNSARFL